MIHFASSHRNEPSFKNRCYEHREIVGQIQKHAEEAEGGENRMTAYMLQERVPIPMKGVGNTSGFGYTTYRWKQVAISDDPEALKPLVNDDRRIVDWSTMEVVFPKRWEKETRTG